MYIIEIENNILAICTLCFQIIETETQMLPFLALYIHKKKNFIFPFNPFYMSLLIIRTNNAQVKNTYFCQLYTYIGWL